MGPLTGVKIIEMKGIGPGPYAGMLLADMGAEVIVVERASKTPGIAVPSEHDVNSRGKKSIALDVKSPAGLEALLALIDSADMVFEGYRPGVAERLGIGPDVCLQRNPKLVYGRMTGWGQTGPMSSAAGHDINYIAISGALAAIGNADKPLPPLNLVGDYAGGSLFLVMGMLAAYIEAAKTGQGQVVDAAITDGSASLMSLFYSMEKAGMWKNQRYSNFLDGAAHFYDVYETAEGKFVSIGPIEPQFYAIFLDKLELDPADFKEQHNPQLWPAMKAQLEAVFKTKTRQQWCDLLEGTDACFAPVLDMHEAPEHPHNKARDSFISINGMVQPAAAPRFSRSEAFSPQAPVKEGANTEQVLAENGFSAADIERLKSLGVLT
jgi:alpha-methylacyl-CoA racemase